MSQLSLIAPQSVVGALPPAPLRRDGNDKKDPATAKEAVNQRLTRPWSFTEGSLGNDILYGVFVVWPGRQLLVPQFKKWALPVGIAATALSMSGGALNAVLNFNSQQKEKLNPPQSKQDSIRLMLQRPATLLTAGGIVGFNLAFDLLLRQAALRHWLNNPSFERVLLKTSTKVLLAYSAILVPLYLAFKANQAAKAFDKRVKEKQMVPVGIQALA